MTFLTNTTLWASRWLGPSLRISVSVRSAFGMTRAKSSNTSGYAFLSCLSGARLDLSAEDDVVALILAECPARPYAELIKSDIPGPSNVRSARSSASRPLPPPTMGVSPIGLSAATPTRGEILVQLGTLSVMPQKYPTIFIIILLYIMGMNWAKLGFFRENDDLTNYEIANLVNPEI